MRHISKAILCALVVLGAVATQTAGGASSATDWIIFSARPAGSGPGQLFRMQTTGEGIEQITKGKLSATNPAFSPNAKRIVFSRLGSGLFVMNPDGSGVRRLTSGKRDTFPVFSPDGKRIAFLRPYRRAWSLYTMSPSGTKLHRLPQAPPAGRPTWTPDGKAILTAAAGDLIKVDSRTGKVLTYYGMSLDLQTAQSATLSPNRKKVAWVGPRVSTGPDDCGEGPCPQFGLYLANVPKPHKARRIVKDTGPAGWAPDGKRIVFVYQGALAIYTIAGGAKTFLPTGTNVALADAPPAWQPR